MLVVPTTGVPSWMPKAALRAATVAVALSGAYPVRLVEIVNVASPPGARPVTVTTPVSGSSTAATPGPGESTSPRPLATAPTTQS